jgi:hypothetical protein
MAATDSDRLHDMVAAITADPEWIPRVTETLWGAIRAELPELDADEQIVAATYASTNGIVRLFVDMIDGWATTSLATTSQRSSGATRRMTEIWARSSEARRRWPRTSAPSTRCSSRSAAAALRCGSMRQTIKNRIRAVEEMRGRRADARVAETLVALRLTAIAQPR